MNAFQTFLASHPFGFVTESDLPVLVAIHRLCPCLIRLGNGRCTAPAQDVAHIIEMIEASGRDYVRDVAVTAQEIDQADQWRPEHQLSPRPPRAFFKPATAGQPSQAQDMSNPVEGRDWICTGNFDGHQVTSDADPGL